ncbi:nuclear transport factor 2 family protein [Chryseobacterium daecheongense]|uniref:nuclear transport factor 2 family protein n=1 Tax=Chryseobacterium daecheongense TaxID=192389 RepID=UPI001FD69A9E|nr:nuclear transport factor 2 family protein [Chryseobacterium daecheongense]UOU99349.1 nuclear transport factor 2 family protein [Chryseobacterium daecheongense]
MKRLSLFILLFSFTFWNCQHIKPTLKDEKLVESIRLLDRYLQNNDDNITDILCPDVSFGHSNGWVQSLDDLKKDFSSKKVVYKEIRQLEISELKKHKNIASVRRKIKVLGSYKNQDFELNLALLEIWKKKNSIWKLWSRQSVEIKP